MNKNRVPFVYLISTVALAANASQQVLLTMQTDSSFELHSIFGSSSLDNATDFAPNNFSCLITDQTTGRQFANVRIPQRVLCGSAFQGALVRVPITFAPQASVQFDILNLSATSPNTINLALHGNKILIAAT